MVEAVRKHKLDTGPENGQLEAETLKVVQAEQTDTEQAETQQNTPERLSPAERVLESYSYEVGQNVVRPGEQGNWQVTSLSEDGQTVYLKQYRTKKPLDLDRLIAGQADISLEAATVDTVDFISLERHELALDEITATLTGTVAELWDDTVNELAETPGTTEDAVEFRQRMTELKANILEATALEAFKKSPDILKTKNDYALKLVLNGVIREQLQARARTLRQEPHPQLEAAKALTAADDYFLANAELRHPEPSPNDEKTESSPVNKLLEAKLGILRTNREPDLELTAINIHDFQGSDELTKSLNEDEQTEFERIDPKDRDRAAFVKRQVQARKQHLKEDEFKRQLAREAELTKPILSTQEARRRSNDAWTSLRVTHNTVMERLQHDPSSYVIEDMYDELNNAYTRALESDLTLEHARLREPRTNEQSSQDKQTAKIFADTLNELKNRRSPTLAKILPKRSGAAPVTLSIPDRHPELKPTKIIINPDAAEETAPKFTPKTPWSFGKIINRWFKREE